MLFFSSSLLTLLFTTTSCFFLIVFAKKCAWDNCPKWSFSPQLINVHIVPHSHDDMGWIKNVDDYYTGARARLVPVGVQYILNTVIDELSKDKSRRFCYAEAGFLHRWLDDHGAEQREQLHRLIVDEGQLELIGGGWTQPDEATTHYVDIIDQYSLGLSLLNATYGKCGHPQVAWQIDPFGHSFEHARLVHKMGHRSLFFARAHYAELESRAKQKELEMWWKVAEKDGEEMEAAHVSPNNNNSILTGAFLRGTYAPPNGFCFDALCNDDQIVDNKLFEGYNVNERVKDFLKFVRQAAKTQRHSHVMMTMGGDFQYSNANQWFTQLDKLIGALNARTNKTGVLAFYSTPGCYAKALQESAAASDQISFPEKEHGGDFFPYASSNHSYWTGYFTSKPAFKGLVRFSSALLQQARKFAAFAAVSDTHGDCGQKSLLKLEAAQSLSTHHDAVTGTSKHNVTLDYTRRLLAGWDQAEHVLNVSFWKIASKIRNTSTPSPHLPSLQFCRQAANQSVCSALRHGRNHSVVLFNAGDRQLDALLVRIPIYQLKLAGGIRVLNAEGEEMHIEMVKTFLSSAEGSPYELLFEARVPPLGFSTYFLMMRHHPESGEEEEKEQKEQQKENESNLLLENSTFKMSRKKSAGTTGIRNFHYGNKFRRDDASSTTKISNNYFRLTFNAEGLLEEMQDLRKNKTHRLSQRFYFYRGMSNKNSEGHHQQASGAYIFRPNGSTPTIIVKTHGTLHVDVVRNALVQEVRQLVNPWISQTIRLYPNLPLIEFDWRVGPLPKNKSALESIEVISRYTIDGLITDGIFWTDSNGRQMIHRKRNDPKRFYEGSEPAAGNYFPVNSRIWVQDAQTRMVLLTDRSQGGSSLEDGQIELMLHRRCFWDDDWGVEEALDEPGDAEGGTTSGEGLIVRGRHWLLLEEGRKIAKMGKENQQSENNVDNKSHQNIQQQQHEQHRPLALELFAQSAPQTMAFVPLEGVSNNSVSRYVELFRTEFSGISSNMSSSSSLLLPNVHLLTLAPLSGPNELLLRLEHFYQRDEEQQQFGESKNVAEVDIQQLFLQNFKVERAEELALGANRPRVERGVALNNLIVTLQPMEIRSFKLYISRP